MNDTQYISPEGMEELKEELQTRKTTTRREIAEKISQAKELGDLSENFEYHDAKEQQGYNESRVNQIEHMIRHAIVIEKKTGADTISIGTTFTVEIGSDTKTFSLVGATEANPMDGKISNESPLGAKFLGLKIGDEVTMQTPGGDMTYKVTTIE